MPDGFAGVYDALGLARPAVALAELALGRLEAWERRPARAAVLGCATGGAALVLAGAGIPVLAIDARPEMLRVARRSARASGLSLRWALGDPASPADVSLPRGFAGRCGLVLAPGSASEQRHPERLGALVGLAAALLDEEGLLALDLPAHPEGEPEARVLCNDDAYLAYAAHGLDLRARQLERRIVWFAPARGRWRRKQHTIVERLWQPEELETAFARAGLLLVGRAPGAGELNERIVYLATKKGGERSDVRSRS
jgi:hypothetical protein